MKYKSSMEAQNTLNYGWKASFQKAHNQSTPINDRNSLTTAVFPMMSLFFFFLNNLLWSLILFIFTVWNSAVQYDFKLLTLTSHPNFNKYNVQNNTGNTKNCNFSQLSIPNAMRLLSTLYCPHHNTHQDFRGLTYGKTVYLPLDHKLQENIMEYFPEKCPTLMKAQHIAT